MTAAQAQVAQPNAFDHISEQWRGKVATDLLAHLTPDGHWDMARFNSQNDYQRHLAALFLRISGRTSLEVYGEVYNWATDVAPVKRGRYCDEVIHSEIVGFPTREGKIYMIPAQVEA